MYDVIVIGSDLSSFIAALLSARYGRKTLLLSECALGDSLTFSGYTFNIDPFPWSGFGAGQIFTKLFSELNIPLPDPAKISPLNPAFQVILPEHRIDFCIDREALINDISREYPGEDSQIQNLYHSVTRVCDTLDKAIRESLDIGGPVLQGPDEELARHALFHGGYLATVAQAPVPREAAVAGNDLRFGTHPVLEPVRQPRQAALVGLPAFAALARSLLSFRRQAPHARSAAEALRGPPGRNPHGLRDHGHPCRRQNRGGRQAERQADQRRGTGADHQRKIPCSGESCCRGKRNYPSSRGNSAGSKRPSIPSPCTWASTTGGCRTG